MGPFFRQLATELQEDLNATVTKINLNGGDAWDFRGPEAQEYTGTLAEWPAYVRRVMEERRIDHVLLFGDLREYHRLAIAEARELQIGVHVFEEGYLRPDYVTLERNGVNARSTLPRSRGFYRRFARDRVERPQPVGHIFWFAALHAACYAVAMYLRRGSFPHYRHHRDLHPLREGLRWMLRGAFHKLCWRLRDRHATSLLTGPLSKRFFLVPLQVHNDFQVRGSACTSVEAFIEQVTATFAKHAPNQQHLVFKHHPLDRAYRNYTSLLQELTQKYGLQGRVHYVADLHLPTLLAHTRGTIVLNSTVGLSSLQRGVPTIALGDSIYSLAGLSYSKGLTRFLRSPGQVDRTAVKGFCTYLARKNQLGGSFYKRACLPTMTGPKVRSAAAALKPVRASGSFAPIAGSIEPR